ncbi:hypothetical protein G7Y89_g9211 [Cudoniella acicularis]|uniref:Sterol regulatory element-binding protein cleavage-activating protein n=1 Tax=Cudoniella acicularis TaxID=354080 RepID=A0A8H4W243_9HELO|nr:hypothetical protein G7Y89_g9211 [Cudoniella acicularis]
MDDSKEPLAQPATMIWYLLYPFRGTVNPPTIGEDHFLRRWIFCLGAIVARHALATITFTTAIGVLLCLPFTFLYPTPWTLPTPQRYAWTPADTSNTSELVPDIYIKQAWIYGSWMRALETDVLLAALDIQTMLLGAGSCDTQEEHNVKNGLGGAAHNISTIFHSPLFYWNCSVIAIKSDRSVIATVNSQTRRPSVANITLIPVSVLGGPVFSYNKLLAADALILTLLYKPESDAGAMWDTKAKVLAQYNMSRWQLHSALASPDGTLLNVESGSISTEEKSVIWAAYALTALYIIFKIRDTQVLKSRAGLLIAIVVQVLLSIVSGLTIATYLHLDLSSVPLEVFPSIPLFTGLENIFRLIGEVEKTSRQDTSSRRVATGLGAVSHTSLIAAGQNLMIFWLLEKTSSPTLVAFSGFAMIAIVVDLALFFTLFAAVLTISVSNYGLQDSFEDPLRPEAPIAQKIPSRFPTSMSQLPQPHGKKSKRNSGQGSLPYLIIGVITGLLLLSVITKFYLDDGVKFYLGQIFSTVSRGRFLAEKYTRHDINSPLKQSKTLKWLNTLDRQTTKEILNLVNTQSQSLVAKVYDPLIIGLKLANRTHSLDGNTPSFLPIDIILSKHFDPSVAFLCSILAFSYAIRKRRTSKGASGTGDPADEKAISTINYLPRGHTLDVFMLAASSKQYLVSVGFDHEFRVWNLEAQSITSRLMIPISAHHVLWPAAAIAVDDKAEWIAVCSKAGGISLWDIKLECFRRSIDLGLGSRIIACFFTPSSYRDSLRPVTHLLIVFASGALADIDVETGNVLSHQISATPIRASHISSHRRMPLRLITISEDEKINITVKREDCWTSQALQFSIPILKSPARLKFTVIPNLRMVGLVLNEDTHQLHLIDFLSGAAIYTFCPDSYKHRTLRAIHSPPQQCLSCGAVALGSFSIAYTNEQDGSFTMRTLTADRDPRIRTGLICLRAERDLRERRCIGFAGGMEKTYTLPNAGVWEITAANGVAGVRRKIIPKAGSKNSRDHSIFRRKETPVPTDPVIDQDWEAWTMTASGIINFHKINSSMFTSRVGPLCSVGRNAIAVGLAEGIALLQFGSKLHDNDDDDDNVGTYLICPIALSSLVAKEAYSKMPVYRSSVEGTAYGRHFGCVELGKTHQFLGK